MTSEIGRFLGSMIEMVREVDDGGSGDCVGKYIQVRVVIDVTHPLRRILRVDVLQDGSKSTMLFRYEKLPEHCFRCERLGHIVRDYGVQAPSDGLEDFNTLYGPWLRASSPVKSGQGRGRGWNFVLATDRDEVGGDLILAASGKETSKELQLQELRDMGNQNQDISGMQIKTRNNLGQECHMDDCSEIQRDYIPHNEGSSQLELETKQMSGKSTSVNSGQLTGEVTKSMDSGPQDIQAQATGNKEMGDKGVGSDLVIMGL
ncbi:hypothetical protein Dsin_008899 [Dipteronia sinensis]|nr:hypothetical protein Dsin_008899 [Dipteronia sinensis]